NQWAGPSLFVAQNQQLPGCAVWDLEARLGFRCGVGNDYSSACNGNTGTGSGGSLPPDFQCVPGARGPGVYDNNVSLFAGINGMTLAELGGVTCITGGLSIGNPDPAIMDLSQLSHLQMIGGELSIYNSTLTTLAGLENLTRAGTLRIEQNN